MTLKDFSAAAKAQANSSINATVPNAYSGSMPAGSCASKGANGGAQAVDNKTHGYVHASDKPKSAVTDQGQAWRSYVCGRTEAPHETSPAQPRASSGSASERQRPATADLDEYLSRQHQTASEGPAGDAEDPEPYASIAASIPLQRDTPSSRENAGHKASFSAEQASRSVPTEASETHTAEQDKPMGFNQRPDVKATHVVERKAAEAGSNGVIFSFGQQGRPESRPTGEHSCGDTPQGQKSFLSAAAAFKFAAPTADGDKARPKVQRSSKRTTGQTGRPVYRQGSLQSFNSNPAGPASASRPPFIPFGGPQPFVFGSGSPAEGAKQPGVPQEPSISSAWPNVSVKQFEPTLTASASRIPTPQPFAAEQASSEPSKNHSAATCEAQVPWAASNPQPSSFPHSFPGTFGSGQGASWAGTTPEKPAQERGAASPDFRTPGSFRSFAAHAQPVGTPKQDPGFVFGGQGADPRTTQKPAQEGPELPEFHTPGPFPGFVAHAQPVETPKQDPGFVFGGQGAHPRTNQKPAQEGPELPEFHTPGPFPGFAAQAQRDETPQQGQAPSQQEPGLIFGEQQAHPRTQEDSAGKNMTAPRAMRCSVYGERMHNCGRPGLYCFGPHHTSAKSSCSL